MLGPLRMFISLKIQKKKPLPKSSERFLVWKQSSTNPKKIHSEVCNPGKDSIAAPEKSTAKIVRNRDKSSEILIREKKSGTDPEKNDSDVG